MLNNVNFEELEKILTDVKKFDNIHKTNMARRFSISVCGRNQTSLTKQFKQLARKSGEQNGNKSKQK